jgi:hypothetical protein
LKIDRTVINEISAAGEGATILSAMIDIGLTRKIHDFRNTEGLAMVQIRCLGRFETKNEAFA